MTALTRSIYARITSDNGPGGLFATDGLLYDGERAGNSRFRRNYSDDVETTVMTGSPVVVWNFENINPEGSTMDGDGLAARVTFEIYGRPPQRPGDTGDIDISAIADRLYGDASSRPDFSPSFGLHRFNPDTTSWNGYTASGMFMFAGLVPDYTDKLIVFRSTFEIRYGRTRPAI